MILGCERPFRLCPIRFVAPLIALIALAAWGCTSAPVTPPSQAVQEPEQKKQEEVKDQAWNPFVVVEPEGRIFITYYGGRGGSDYTLRFNRSLDDGLTWLSEPVQLDGPPLRPSLFGFHRLETNGDGRLSVTWAIERKEETFLRVRELRNRQSSDSGATWSREPLRWQFQTQANYPAPQTGRDGVVYLLWIEGPTTKAAPQFIRTAAPGMPWVADPITLPIGKAEKDRVGRRGRRFQRESAWSVLATDPGGALYAAWQEAFEEGTDILFNRSLDGGATWLETSLHLNSPPPGPKHTARIPAVVAPEPGRIYVVWEDSRHNTSDLYLNRSLDGGKTWLEQDIWITAVRPHMAAATNPLLSADRSGNVYVLWTDIRDVPKSFFFSRSRDGGLTWLPSAIRLDRHGPNETTSAPRLASDDAGHVYAAWWQGTKEMGTIRFRRSDDYGATWTEEQILDRGLGKDGPRFPWLSADGKGGVYVIWSSDRTGRYQLYLNRSKDHGKSWLPQEIQITGTPPSKSPSTS